MKSPSPQPSPRQSGEREHTASAARVYITQLEPRKVRKRHLAGVDMHAAELGAAVQGRKHFSGIEQALRVEGAFDALLLVQIDVGKHLAHQVALLDADAVLAGQDAAELDAAAQNVGAKSLGAVHLAGLV